jgi:hypothetical protein
LVIKVEELGLGIGNSVLFVCFNVIGALGGSILWPVALRVKTEVAA